MNLGEMNLFYPTGPVAGVPAASEAIAPSLTMFTALSRALKLAGETRSVIPRLGYFGTAASKNGASLSSAARQCRKNTSWPASSNRWYSIQP